MSAVKNKVDVSKIVADMQKLYAKDKKIKSIICSGDSVKTEYSLDDVIPFGDSPLTVLTGLPGLPFNKIAQVAGKPDCGQTALRTAAIPRG